MLAGNSIVNTNNTCAVASLIYSSRNAKHLPHLRGMCIGLDCTLLAIDLPSKPDLKIKHSDGYPCCCAAEVRVKFCMMNHNQHLRCQSIVVHEARLFHYGTGQKRVVGHPKFQAMICEVTQQSACCLARPAVIQASSKLNCNKPRYSSIEQVQQQEENRRRK